MSEWVVGEGGEEWRRRVKEGGWSKEGVGRRKEVIRRKKKSE